MADKVIPSQIVSHQLSLDDAPDACKCFDKRDNGWTKIILTPEMKSSKSWGFVACVTRIIKLVLNPPRWTCRKWLKAVRAMRLLIIKKKLRGNNASFFLELFQLGF